MTKDVCIDASPVCSVRELGKTVEAILSSRKHPNLLQQLHDNVDSLQKSRYCPCAFHHDHAGQDMAVWSRLSLLLPLLRPCNLPGFRGAASSECK